MRASFFNGITDSHLPDVKLETDGAGFKLPEILLITSYPPRECGIATYSQDLVGALKNKFHRSFQIRICPLESENEQHMYPFETEFVLNTDRPGAFTQLAQTINCNANLRIVLLQHEFGFFEKKEAELTQFLANVDKPVILVLHTVLPLPDETLKRKVNDLVAATTHLVVMTQYSSDVLLRDYGVIPEKITVIPHGTHLVPHADKELLKAKYNLTGRKVLSTFGLLSSGKSIETTLDAMPQLVVQDPEIIFLIIGKTHPSVVKREGETYRQMLETKVHELQLENHVQFVNYFVPLPDLLEYLQLTDIYLFTSKDPNQAVSGTFSYAISCGCPVVSTPIPHAREVLKNDAGICIEFGNSDQLGRAVSHLLKDEQLRKNISSNGLHRMASTAWENAAIAHARLFERMDPTTIPLRYKMPMVNLDHVKKMTTGFGIIQFSQINQPDIGSGYTVDDNARALVAMCQHYELSGDEEDLAYIRIYLDFISHCLQADGYFLNYVDEFHEFTDQNYTTNLADANGRAVWALGYLVSISKLLPEKMVADANETLTSALLNVNKIHSTRAMAFLIKGLYYRNTEKKSIQDLWLIRELADRLVQMYRHEASKGWLWFESYLTYANSTLPEALLCAWMATGEVVYKEIARSSFDFLVSKIFRDDRIHVISNKNWLQKGAVHDHDPTGGEQPIDVAYTILALSKFYRVFKEENYRRKMEIAFSWFLGNNHLHQIIYNPCTGGCYDGLEGHYVNLNQGAESTVSYLMARLTMDKPEPGEEAFQQVLIESQMLKMQPA